MQRNSSFLEAISYSYIYLLFPEGWFYSNFEAGFVTDEEVERRESKLRDLLNNDPDFRVKEGISVEVAQVYLSINQTAM